MSETIKKTGKAIVACGDLKTNENNKGITIENGTCFSSAEKIGLTGMEIDFGEDKACTITNETPDGRTAVIDKKTGNIIGYLESDGTLNRKLSEIDRKKSREEGQGR